MRLTSVILLLVVFSISEGLWCPDGSFRFPNEYTCALPDAQAKNYYNAKDYCESLGGELAKIVNTFENTYLTALISPDFKSIPPYIGVVKGANGDWIYSDGTTLSYRNWNSGEDTKQGSCAFLDPKTAKWNNTDCSSNRPSYCTFNGIKLSCPYNWVYSRDTDYCYYLQNIEYMHGENWKLYNFSTAELECQQLGQNSHLVSIHSSAENNFVKGLISSNVRAMLDMPSQRPCDGQWAWIGYTGNGTLWTGNWTDGSDVDYLSLPHTSDAYPVAMANDPNCGNGYQIWTYFYLVNQFARFVCKMPSKGFSIAIQKERMAKNKNF